MTRVYSVTYNRIWVSDKSQLHSPRTTRRASLRTMNQSWRPALVSMMNRRGREELRQKLTRPIDSANLAFLILEGPDVSQSVTQSLTQLLTQSPSHTVSYATFLLFLSLSLSLSGLSCWSKVKSLHASVAMFLMTLLHFDLTKLWLQQLQSTTGRRINQARDTGPDTGCALPLFLLSCHFSYF